MEDELAHIPLGQIRDPWVMLRFVDKQSIEYLEMLESIRAIGVLSSVTVRRIGENEYELITGMHRLTVCRELRRPTIPCTIKKATDDEVLAWQIQENAVHAETRPVDFAKQLKRIQKLRPGITQSEMAVMVRKSPPWISKMLGLLNLSAKTQRLVALSKIPLSSAYMLAKIPSSLQPQFVDQACTMPPKQFEALAASVIKRWMEDVRQGKLDHHFNDNEFKPQPWLRSLKDILREIDKREHGPNLIVAERIKTAAQGFLLGLKWAANLDRFSVEEQRRAAELKRHKNLKSLLQERIEDE